MYDPILDRYCRGFVHGFVRAQGHDRSWFHLCLGLLGIGATKEPQRGKQLGGEIILGATKEAQRCKGVRQRTSAMILSEVKNSAVK